MEHAYGWFHHFVQLAIDPYIISFPQIFGSPMIYSICYNGAYLGAEAALTIMLLMLNPVKKALGRVKQIAI